MNHISKWALAATLGTLLLGGLPQSSYGQDDPSQKQIASLQFENADVRDVLKALFEKVAGINYSIDPGVQGTVTVALKNTTFEVALNAILRQVDATYRIEGGIYQIIRKVEDAPISPIGQDGTTPAVTTNRRTVRIKILHADPQVIARLIGTANGYQDFGFFPEMSTLMNTPQNQGGQGGQGGGGGGFGGGGGGLGGGGGGLGGGGGFGGGGGGLGGGGGGFGGGGGGFGGGGGGRGGF